MIFMNRYRLLFVLLISCFQVNAQHVIWASKVIEVSSKQSHATSFQPNQALGKPSVLPSFGTTQCAWTPKDQVSQQIQFIHVGFDSALSVSQIIVNQPSNPGSIHAIYLYDESGKKHQVYSDTTSKATSLKPLNKEGELFRHFLETTNYKAISLRLELNTKRIPGYNYIDAIGISSEKKPYEIEINLADKLYSSKAENIGENVNNVGNNYAPIISSDGKKIYFTRKNYEGNLFDSTKSEIWVTEMDAKGIFQKAINLGEPINNKNQNSPLSISPDGQTLMVMGIYNKDLTPGKGISISHLNDKSTWDWPQKIEIKDYENLNNFAEFNLSTDGTTLLLTVETKDNNHGLKDVYVSFLQDDNTFSKPKNLGNTINTASDETGPFLGADGRTLYFSTRGYPGYGNADLFMSYRLDDTWTNWTEPKNLGPSINSEKFDAYFTIPASGDYAYFSSNLNSGSRNQIYRIKLSDDLKPKPSVLISGKVLNQKTKEPISTGVFYESLSGGLSKGIANSNPLTGAYSIVLPSGDEYGFLASKEGFISVGENINLKDIKKYTEIEVNLFLVPVEEGAIIRLNNIFFDFNQAILKNEAKPELERLLKFLNEKPSVSIEIAGHTDNVGSDQANNLLSEQRAEAVKNWLIGRGISIDRISIIGYGKKKPVAENTTEKGRALNRRIEMKILTL
jgi:OmpA-OmpF porin, OOP family